ncbi:MAG: AI-2E family transporter [Schleiferilactobacillus harbinensis]|jgi:predicted PurR-regulated permease PerM|nr:AI-2E family transporter [Schleiferilactobacillus harbinensis]MCI1912991.1 AI-2E family transporter [Schleiferilactobacillus harbinensis]
MEQQQNSNSRKQAHFNQSWFFRWFVNNKLTVALVNILLTLIVLFLFTKVDGIFAPVGKVINILLPSVLLAGVFYYLMEPTVSFAEHKWHVPRVVSTLVLFVIILALLIWGVLTLIPLIQTQVGQFVAALPGYWTGLEKWVTDLLADSRFHAVTKSVEDAMHNVSSNWITRVQSGAISALQNIGGAVGTITGVVMAIITAPFLLFFMLKSPDAFRDSIVRIAPPRWRDHLSQILTEISQSISNYIRGQLTVAFWVGVMFAIGYTVIGQRYGVTLAILAAILNLIPYLGSFLAMVPSVLVAAMTSPQMIFWVLVVFMVEQTIEQRVVSPLVVGSKMDMHPVTTLMVLLGAGGLYGLPGVLFGIPVYAIIKIIWIRLWHWFTSTSSLYETQTSLPAPAPVVKASPKADEPAAKEPTDKTDPKE